MKKRKTGSVPIFLVLWLTGCAVGDPRYPASWDPLEPPLTLDCRNFEGMYADRGEAPEHRRQPSLTRELFGPHSAWEDATRVELRFAAEDRLEIEIWGASSRLFRRFLSAAAGEFRCDAGRLVIEDRRWVAEVLIAGREHMTLELHDAGNKLVASINERTFGVIFAIVPVAADARHWYRFQRIAR